MLVPGKATCLAAAIVLTASLAGAQTLNGPNFSVETYATGPQGAVDVAVDSGGHFIVTWAGDRHDDDPGIRARRYRSSGVPLGAEFASTPSPRTNRCLPRWRWRRTAASWWCGRAGESTVTRTG